MNLEIVLSLLLFFTAVCYGLLGIRLLGGKREVGSLPVGATFIAIGIWVLGGVVELVAPNFLVFSIGRTGHFLGTALVPVTILICFREYTGAQTSRTMIAALLILPVLSILVAATNSMHEMMWYLPATNDAGEFLTRPVRLGTMVFIPARTIWLCGIPAQRPDTGHAQYCRCTGTAPWAFHAGRFLRCSGNRNRSI